ncbi:hypothetical protein [Prosthecobacter vanneervenii]|uniref:Uncharacterized protein n=1 Tax=Prosthecobacter vanneervenii TaxID=48466 RepID=A0A7W7YEA4_9BACT|nr:hypothetical protein [Prosthecobacter vanneervenii]MBB5034615.1 hypothetical protein [Prosthecobacter vanneervenii]
MTPRQKCPHCGKFAEFHEDFCSQCWSHRSKGKVLTEEQIASCRSRQTTANDRKRWQDELDVWQKKMLPAVIAMILWCSYGVYLAIPFYLKLGVGELELAIGVFCTAGFAIGGYLIGGSKALKLACSVLIAASLVASYYIFEFMLEVMRGEVQSFQGFAYSCIRLVLCGTIFISALKIKAIKPPAV